ncbi:hypothetical protein DESC_120088 [Desulfosarcina cetonica]|nr:hypothetical protein DESC_120088 [Desulfosarcina cetonica]
MDVVHYKDYHRAAALALFLENIPQLGETPPAEDHFGDHFEIAKHAIFSFFRLGLRFLE